jgi:plastocyanin
MRLRLFPVITIFLLLANVALAKEVWLSIGGTTAGGTFRTDARIFNPSTTKDIQIQAWYLPVGNVDNSAVQPISVTVVKRQQLVYNDVVTSLFHSSGLGAIRLKSDDDFIATQKIYAVTSSGTLGQFVAGVDAPNAKKNGVIIQLQGAGSFHTNVGAANPNAAVANVTWRLYDKNNAPVGNAKTITMQPYGVIGPGGLSGYTDSVGTADISDAWLSYTSDQPIVAYGSVIDNGTTDPTYIPAAEDTGAFASQTPSSSTFVVSEHGGPNTATSAIDITPAIGPGKINPGDTATFQITANDTTHGFRLVDPDGNIVLDLTINAGTTVSKTVMFVTEGTWLYYCTNTTCSPGHNSMQGTFAVGKASVNPPGY